MVHVTAFAISVINVTVSMFCVVCCCMMFDYVVCCVVCGDVCHGEVFKIIYSFLSMQTGL